MDSIELSNLTPSMYIQVYRHRTQDRGKLEAREHRQPILDLCFLSLQQPISRRVCNRN